jgi:hypothetical protein
MPPNSEIEKLERRWKDNPMGTGFAPYAEALRKQGEVDLARDVLRQGLENHPDHIPGNIVLGRCCLDLVEDGPAETAFRHVLDLDVENVIALKALAEITERQGRLDEAVDWLTRLVASDPNNDEAVAHLARVEASRAAAAAAATRPLTPSGAQAVPPMPEPEVVAAAPSVEDQPAGAEASAPAWEAAPVEAPEIVEASLSETLLVADLTPVSEPPVEPTMAEAETLEMVQHQGEPEPVAESETGPTAPESVPGLLVSEIDSSAVSSDIVVEGIEIEEPPEIGAEEDSGLSRVEGLTGSAAYIVGVEKEDSIELSASPSSEFHAPDDSSSLAALSSSAAESEFQTPDSSLELSPASSGGSEFQTPDVSEQLSGSWESQSGSDEPAEPESEPSFTLGTASLELPPEPGSALPEGVEPEVDEVAATAEAARAAEPEMASEAVSPPEAEAAPPMAEAVTPASAAADFEAPVVEEAPREEAEAPRSPGPGSSRTSELRLIYPDDTDQPEPPKVRRISQEVPAIVIPAASSTEPVLREPEPVMTESMAELYARQGHAAEALKVYRALAAQQPGEAKFRDRIRELEAAQAPRPKKTGVAAIETGGESVESFFRSLASARPGLMGLAAAAAEQGRPTGKGAPTRPASDSLSLSAIFGEEPARTQPPPPPESPPPAAADAFSFDQFFGKPAPESSGPSGEAGKPSDEDLDQFQSWLKGLKR